MLATKSPFPDVSETTGRILIIEDQQSSRTHLSNILRKKGFETAEAENAIRGYNKLNGVSFDLILLDINLPGPDGFELCAKIKNTASLKHIPIIFLSGLNDEQSIARGFEMGAVDYLTKPFKEPELLARVTTQIKLKKSLEICKQKHKLVAESENKFRSLFMNSPVMLLQVNTDWKIQHVNNLFIECTGLSAAEVTETPIDEYLEGCKIIDIFTSPQSVFKNNNKTYLRIKRKNLKLEVKINVTLQKINNIKQHIVALEIVSDHHSLLPQILTNAEKYKQLFSASGDSIFLIDSEGIITDANPAATLMFECNKKALTGKKVSALSAGISLDNSIEKIQQEHTAGTRSSWQYVELKSPTGKKISAEANITLLDSPEEGYFLILHDLVNRKKYQEKILIFNQLAETSGQGLALIWPEGKIYYVNPTLKKLLNFNQQIYDLNWETFIPEDVKNYFQHNILPKIIKEEKWAGKLSLQSLEGNEIYAYQNISLIKNEKGKAHLIAISITDMREAYSAEQEKIRLSGRFRELAERLPQTLFELDTTGKIIYANKFGLSLFGYHKEDLNGKLNVKDLLHRDDVSLFAERLSVLIKEEQKDNNFEYRFITKDGSLIFGTVYAQYFEQEDDDGIVQGLMVDNTSNKKLMETIHSYNAELKKLNATKDRFFSILAHDLKNPFTTLIGFSELLVRKTATTQFDANQIQMYANEVLKAANNSYNLVENLLDWSHSQREKLIINPENLVLSDIVEENIKLFNATAENKQIKFYHHIDNSLQAYADYNTLNTVMRNLISNAIKFSYPGGKIYINGLQSKENIIITIADQGKGIPQENMSRLFQIDRSITTEGTQNERGTGLGLVLCKEFVEKNNGSITVNSKVEKGSVFTVTLPKGKVE